MGDNIDNTTIAKELEDFQKKKEDVFKSMGMLNNLSEKLSISIHEEEKRINELQAKEIVKRVGYELPTMDITSSDILNGEFEFKLNNYQSHKTLKAKLSN